MTKISKKFRNINGKLVDLEIIKESQNYVEIFLSFSDFKQTKNAKIRSLFLLLLAFFVYLFSFSERSAGILAAFSVAIGFQVISTISLVKFEKITLVKGFVLNISTKYWMGKEFSQVIPLNYVRDVVINEVLYFVSISKDFPFMFYVNFQSSSKE